MVPTDAELPRRFGFEGAVVDLDEYLISRAGESVSVEPQVFDVLHYLMQHRARVVTKEELLDNIWGDRFVSESALTSRIKSARQAVGDDGKAQRVIRTVHGRGYQFVAAVEAVTPAVDDASTAAPPTRPVVPAPRAQTYGRSDLLADLDDRLAPGTVVTLLGPAGVGKTHLARRVASDLDPRFVDGAWFAQLANVRDPAAVGVALLDGLGASQSVEASVEETIVALLRERKALLVLDNCDHVLEGVVPLLSVLLDAAPTLSILATSRQRLGVAGEQLIDVPVLDPASGAELFAAQADGHGVELDATGDEVATICSLLDNLPLALELASAHTRVLNLQQLTGLLDDRLQLLTAIGPTDDHHRTLESAIATSYDALEPSLQETLCRFSVFAGQFALGAASAVACGGDRISSLVAIQHLVALAERSLVTVEMGGDEPRYRLLESVRLFAAERLSDVDGARTCHVEHFCNKAERLDTLLNSSRLGETFDMVLDDWANYRVAIDYALDLGLAERAARLLSGLEEFAAVTQRYEFAEWAERVLDELGGAGDSLDSVRAGLARFLIFKDFDRAKDLVDALDDPNDYFGALDASAWWYFLGPDHDQGDVWLQAMIDHSARSGGLRELYANGTAVFLRSTSAGRDLEGPLARVRHLAGRHGDVGVAFRALAEARNAFAQGDTAETIRQCSRTLEAAERHGIGILSMGAARARSMGLATHDDLELVTEQLLDSLRRYQGWGHWTAATIETPLVARVLIDRGALEEAATILGAYRAANYAKSWSASIAQPLIDHLEAEAPEHVARLDDDTLAGGELCAYCIRELERLQAG